MGIVNDTEIAFCKSATILSLICCFSIVISVITFRQELWKRYYIRLIFFVTASDLLAVFPFAFGPTHGGDPICYIQAIFTNFFAMSAVLWTAFIVYILYDVVVKRHSLEGIYLQAHVVCWGIPLLTTFLPLTTDKFGVYDGQESGYCGITQRSDADAWTSDFWNLLFDIILICSLFFTASLLYLIYSSLHQQDPQFVTAYIDMAIRKLKYYPLIIILCWSIQFYLDVVVIYFCDDRNLTPFWLLIISDTLICLQGSLTAWAFWAENREVRLMWYMLYKKYISLGFRNGGEDDEEEATRKASALAETEADIDYYKRKWNYSQSEGNRLLSGNSEQESMLREKLNSISSTDESYINSKSNRATVSGDYDFSRSSRSSTVVGRGVKSPLQASNTSRDEERNISISSIVADTSTYLGPDVSPVVGPSVSTEKNTNIDEPYNSGDPV